MEEYPHNVMDLEKQFSTEESCKDYLFRLERIRDLSGQNSRHSRLRRKSIIFA